VDEVDLQIGDADEAVGGRTRGGGVAQGDPHPGQELVQAEGLGQVVVRAEVEGGDLVPLLAAGGEDDDGGLVVLADAPDHGQAVDARQPQVEEDDVRAQAPELVEGRLPALRQVGLVPPRRERGPDRPQELRVVVDHQDARAHRAVSTTPGTRPAPRNPPRPGRSLRMPPPVSTAS
jgi:hypothetical protein